MREITLKHKAQLSLRLKILATLSTEVNNKLKILAFTLYAIIARCKEIKSQLLSKKFQLLLIVDHFFTFLHSRPLKNYEDGRRINIKSSFEGCIVKFCIKQIAKITMFCSSRNWYLTELLDFWAPWHLCNLSGHEIKFVNCKDYII